MFLIEKPAKKKARVDDETAKSKKFDDKKKLKNGGAINKTAPKMSEKEANMSKKELKEKRRKAKLSGNYDLALNMKKIWETLRRADTTDDVRKKLCGSLYDNVKGKISQMAFAHDTCRVIECLVQYGNERHRTGVFDELKETLVELSKSKYARFMIKKLLLYCNEEQKKYVIQSFIGNVTKLIKHSVMRLLIN